MKVTVEGTPEELAAVFCKIVNSKPVPTPNWDFGQIGDLTNIPINPYKLPTSPSGTTVTITDDPIKIKGHEITLSSNERIETTPVKSEATIRG